MKLEDFSFFTFFLGLHGAEALHLARLYATFPYREQSSLTVIDQWAAVKEELETQETFGLEWRAYLKSAKQTVTPKLHATLKEKLPQAHFIEADKHFFHGEAIDYVLRSLSKTKYTVIMDSDVYFLNDAVMPAVFSLAEKAGGDFGAAGHFLQRLPFFHTLRKDVSSSFHLNMQKNHNGESPMNLERLCSFEPNPRMSRFPRLDPSFLIINTEIFKANNMSFRNLYLDVVSDSGTSGIFGDNGASFLYQLALAGERIIEVDVPNYIGHSKAGSYSSEESTIYSWYNGNLQEGEL